jgi:protein-S-isoprenylcysteine O-methyltransferase Ste14
VLKFGSVKSFFLVLLQFTFIIFIFITGRIIPDNIFLQIIFVLSFIPGLFAILVMKFNFNIAPDFKPGAIFINKGPYKFIRHPMYTTVLLSILCLVINYFSVLRLSIFIFLSITLIMKITFEEKILSDKFDSYREYKIKTKKLIPYIY